MKEDNNIKSDNIGDLRKSYEIGSRKVSSVLYSTVILELSANTGNDFKALGRIKVEDSEIQESILELGSEFSKFIVQQTDKSDIQDIESEHDTDISSTVSICKDFNIEESLLQKILDFFRELYHGNEEDIGLDYELHPFNIKKKKKKFILESIIAFLKKLLRDSKSLNLKQLLDQQILELQEQLSKELDPALRRLLQERLMLLAELRGQLIEVGVNSKLLFSFFMLSSLANISLQQGAAIRESKSSGVLETKSLIYEKDIQYHQHNVAIGQDNSQSNVAAVLVPHYVQGILYAKVNNLSYKHTDYWILHRDMMLNPIPNIAMNQGMFVSLLIRIFNFLADKIKTAVSGVLKEIDTSVSSQQRYYDTCRPSITLINPLAYSYVNNVTFQQECHPRKENIGLSLLSYEMNISCTMRVNSCTTYLRNVEVQMVGISKVGGLNA